MRSKTSCFNGTLFLSNLRRFSPVWIAYTVIWLFILPFNLVRELRLRAGWMPVPDGTDTFCSILRGALSAMPILTALLAMVVGIAVFQYLYTARSANLYHSLPIRREGLFLTAWVSGLVIMVIPIVILGLVTLACGQGAVAGGLLLRFLAAMAGMSVLCLSMTALVAMITGNLVAHGLLYWVFHFITIGVWALIANLLSSFLRGVELNNFVPIWIQWATPIINCLDRSGVSYDPMAMSGLGAYGIYAAVGVVLTAIALLVYRRRPVESAGDLISFRKLRPVFLVAVSICFGLAVTLLVENIYFTGSLREGNAFLRISVMMVGWSFVGFFVAEMLLRKSFHVFRRRALALWGGTIVVVLALLCCFRFDVFGIERHVPRAETVQSVTVSLVDGACEVDPEEAVALHQAILDEDAAWEFQTNPTIDAPYEWGLHYVQIRYTLNSGRTVTRSYHISLNPDGSTTTSQLAWMLYTDPTYYENRVFGGRLSQEQMNDANVYFYDGEDGETIWPETVEGASVAVSGSAATQVYRGDDSASLYLEGSAAWLLYEAYLRDLEAGRIDYLAHLTGENILAQVDFNFFAQPNTAGLPVSEYRESVGWSWANIQVDPAMTETVACLQSLRAVAQEEAGTNE